MAAGKSFDLLPRARGTLGTPRPADKHAAQRFRLGRGLKKGERTKTPKMRLRRGEEARAIRNSEGNGWLQIGLTTSLNRGAL